MKERVTRRSLLGGAGAAGLIGAFPAAAQSARADEGSFQGKVVLITGATSGIGEATAKAFAAQGAKVGFCGRREQLGREVERQIRRAGGQARYIKADVRVPAQVKAFVDEVARHFGGLDIAFNNAGVSATADPHELTVEQWDDVNDTNARGVFLSIKYEVPHMLSKGGVIICTSSGAAERARPNGAAYTASKRAVQGIVKAAALAYGTRGIRVNAILPGTTDTPFIRVPGLSDEEWEKFKKAYGPLNIDGLERVAEPEEIAGAVLALASPEFGYMTGTSVPVDGGATAGRKMVLPPGTPRS
ncbi:SDR family NAD(P)-dependent oxidoreductase [Nonomuraea sp. 3N208]|uniref:SDR family NAD(P)-dependent oxidoreductase n=1 Tax=Nonomuraea sp. 3N208 TaxID=3457421 RepID=UPI003FD15319